MRWQLGLIRPSLDIDDFLMSHRNARMHWVRETGVKWSHNWGGFMGNNLAI